MQPLVFLFVYWYVESKSSGENSRKNRENPSGLGHLRRCTLLKKLLLHQASLAQQKVSVKLEPFSSQQHLLDTAKNFVPDVMVLDARENVESATLLLLRQSGIFTVILDSDDVEALKVANYHVRALPYAPWSLKPSSFAVSSFISPSEKVEEKLDSRHFWRTNAEDMYQQKDDFSQKSVKYSLPWANLYGWEYLCAQSWEKVPALPQNIRKLVFYVGSFFDDEALLQRYQQQWKKVFSRSFWNESSRKKEMDFSLECVIIIDSPQEKHWKKMCDFLQKSNEQNDEQNEEFIPISVCRCENVLSEEKMAKLLADCHLFLTHFGVSFLQALEAGIAVLLLLPTKYHQSISHGYFYSLVVSRVKSYDDLLKNIEQSNVRENIGASQDKWVHVLLDLARCWSEKKKLVGQKKSEKENVCYYCQSEKVRFLHRFPTFSWEYCDDCLAAIQRRYGLEKIFPENFPDYNSDYFEKEYQQSYGHTYGEDEKKIKMMAQLRLKNIQSFLKKTEKKQWVLDIGAAYGFFLDVMREQGSFATAGIEISSHAFSRAQFHHQLFQGDAQKLDFNDILNVCDAKYFDIITMWYVIEHFPCLHSLLRKISDCQKKGGIFAFSTPNFLGLSARKAKENFIANSPSDHFHLLTSRGLAALLKRYGYRLRKIVSTGIHRDRYEKFFPILSRFIPFSFYRFFARKKNWGDTMELYFSKV